MKHEDAGLLGWVRTIGWQLIVLSLVIVIGISISRVVTAIEQETRIKSEMLQKFTNYLPENTKEKFGVLMDNWIAESKQRAQMLQDVGKVSKLISDCLPEESKSKIKNLVEDATNFAVRELQRELDREKARAIQPSQ